MRFLHDPARRPSTRRDAFPVGRSGSATDVQQYQPKRYIAFVHSRARALSPADQVAVERARRPSSGASDLRLSGGRAYLPPIASWPTATASARSTCHTLIREGIKVPARRAPPLSEVIGLAVAAGWDYLIVDGVNIPTESESTGISGQGSSGAPVNTSGTAGRSPGSPPRTGTCCGCWKVLANDIRGTPHEDHRSRRSRPGPAPHARLAHHRHEPSPTTGSSTAVGGTRDGRAQSLCPVH